MKIKQGFFYIVATIGFAAVLLIWHRMKEAMQPKTQAAPTLKLTVSVAHPHVASVKRYIDVAAQCTACNRITIVPQVPGTLSVVNRPKGGLVKKGELLFKISDHPFKADLQQSEAQLAIDQARHDLNVLQLRRSEELHSGNFISKQEYDTYKANVAVSRAQLDVDAAARELKKIRLEYCTIVAPFAGELSTPQADVGAYVTVGTSLAILNQVRPIFADAFLSEKHLSALLPVKRGEIEVKARLMDNSSVTQNGKLIFIGNEIDKTTGTFVIRAEFENENLSFWPGCSIDLKICYDTISNAILVPESSIHEGMKGSFVYIINAQGLTEMRLVTTGQIYSHWIVVTGLKGDERIIADGHALLAPGMPVQVGQTVAIPDILKQ